ncbi:MAG TPA: VOC family protein [Acidimicrobiales bacterium]|nr:VOC family protein [Acidimicrobiales bacterium]
MGTEAPGFNQINLIVRDMDKTVAFYRRLGLTIDAEPGSEHVGVSFPNGMSIDLDTVGFVPMWDSAWKGATGGSTVIGFSVPSREAVDELYATLTDDGYTGRQPPYDAFWGTRYAMVEDPDGNPVGLMSPRDPERNTWPPSPPPSGG